jgi:uncharacterized protein (DUF488 family)
VTAELLTIGYEGCIIGKVIAELRAAGATHLLDVRAVPQSRKPGFSKRLLGAAVEEAGMRYVHLRGLGTPKAGRQAVRHGDVAGMHRIFGAHMATDEAQVDLANAVSLAAGQRACLLCFERDHRECHRAIVAGLVAERTGLPVRHLVAEAV